MRGRFYSGPLALFGFVTFINCYRCSIEISVHLSGILAGGSIINASRHLLESVIGQPDDVELPVNLVITHCNGSAVKISL